MYWKISLRLNFGSYGKLQAKPRTKNDLQPDIMIILLYCMQDSSSTSILQNWNLQLPANKTNRCARPSAGATALQENITFTY